MQAIKRKRKVAQKNLGCISQMKKYKIKVWGRKGKEENELLTY